MTFSAADGDDEVRDYRDVYEYADDGPDEEKCPEVNLPSRLLGRCEVSDFCSNITCQLEVGETRATVIFKINRCEDPVTATITIKSSRISVNWKHTFKDGEIIEIFPAANSMTKVSISVKVELKKEGKKLHFKVRNINTEYVLSAASTALKKPQMLLRDCTKIGNSKAIRTHSAVGNKFVLNNVKSASVTTNEKQ